eukprot:SAG31_NODE_951_length_10810_cov_3.083652_5_plen_173_part_00
MVAELQPTVPASRATRRLLDSNQHQHGGSCLLGIASEGCQFGKGPEPMVDYARHLLVPLLWIVLPRKIVISSEAETVKDDTFSISALHLAIKVPYFSNSGHKNEKVTFYLDTSTAVLEAAKSTFRHQPAVTISPRRVRSITITARASVRARTVVPIMQYGVSGGYPRYSRKL